MLIDKALNDNSSNIARKILERGILNIETSLSHIFGSSEFDHIACADFSISLRQRRLILGLPIGSYINWSKYPFFPLELDINSCGVHILKMNNPLDLVRFKQNLLKLQKRLNNKELSLDGTILKWNFSRRNHFINVYQDADENDYIVFHSSGETKLFDWNYLNSIFKVNSIQINGRDLPFILDNDVLKYWDIAKYENDFFFKRHSFLFNEMLDVDYSVFFADFHFGMLKPGEILMGCSKVKVGELFPILTRPFENIFIAEAGNPDNNIKNILSDNYTIVPHGLGMTIPNEIINIIPDEEQSDFVKVIHRNGSYMITDTLEHIGVSYRENSVIDEMAKKHNFNIKFQLFPKLCLKL